MKTIVLTVEEYKEYTRQIVFDCLKDFESSKPKRKPLPEHIGLEEVSRITGRSKNTLYQDLSKKRIPVIESNGRKKIFKRSDIIKWVDAGFSMIPFK